MQEVMLAIRDLYSLLEKKSDTYSILIKECKDKIEENASIKKQLDSREQGIVTKEIKYGIIEFAEKVRDEAVKIKNEAEMLLSMSSEERKTIAEWCDKEKMKVAHSMKELEEALKDYKMKENRLKEDRKALETEKLNFKNTIIKSFDRK